MELLNKLLLIESNIKPIDYLLKEVSELIDIILLKILKLLLCKML